MSKCQIFFSSNNYKVRGTVKSKEEAMLIKILKKIKEEENIGKNIKDYVKSVL